MTWINRVFPKLIAVAVSFMFPLICCAAELSILAAGATRLALSEIVESYQRVSGNKLNVEYGPVGVLMQRLAKGATPDIVFVTADVIGEVERKGWTVSLGCSDERPMVDMTSPDGRVNVRLGIVLGALVLVYQDPSLADADPGETMK